MRYVVFLLFLLLAIPYWLLHSNVLDSCCSKDLSEKMVSVAEQEPTEDYSFLAIHQSDSVAINKDGYALVDSINAQLDDDDIMRITGYYYGDEKNPSKERDLGIHRANLFKGLISTKYDSSRIMVDSKRLDGNSKGGQFLGAMVEAMKVSKDVIQTEDEAYIYFPYNSTRKINSREIAEYLEQVAKRVNSSGERISLTGHTDNLGNNEDNHLLGLARANVIRSELMNLGVDGRLISVHSKGESQPIASNDTRDGRAKNRRTELKIIQ